MSTTDAIRGFDAHTAVEDDRPAAWRAAIDPDLSGFGATHGGYVAAIALRAMSSWVLDPEQAPRSLHVQLMSAIKPGYVELWPRVDRAGSSLTATSLRIEQRGDVAATAQALFGAPRTSMSYRGLEMPEVPGPDQCRSLTVKPAPDARVGLLVDHRPAAQPMPLSGAERAEIQVWMRLVEERPLDHLVLAMLAEAGPPALFGHLAHFVPIPSVEISLQFIDFEAAHESRWVLGTFRTSHAGAGYAVEDGELWSPGGALLVQARQLRRILDQPKTSKEARNG
jgi:acyl-CoA thioesterase